MADGFKINNEFLILAIISCFVTVIAYKFSRDNEEISKAPITEAEIFLAYGKKEAAVKCLENAMMNGAGNEVKEKLMEIRSNE